VSPPIDVQEDDAPDEPQYSVVEVLAWRGFQIEVLYTPDWLVNFLSHLSIETLEPVRAGIPITETGYLSHFLEPGLVEANGGPAAFVRAWLDEAAKDPLWKEQEAAARQFSLF